ncbi:MAG: 23S rRNA (uracil(1939)-C(5))-methyltransferase RlmD [Bacillota bacterium]|nr:23S rRNA (uracil(1939)-C(5))-methyltransferase RlmD [Bacillota bacterium]
MAKGAGDGGRRPQGPGSGSGSGGAGGTTRLPGTSGGKPRRGGSGSGGGRGRGGSGAGAGRAPGADWSRTGGVGGGQGPGQAPGQGPDQAVGRGAFRIGDRFELEIADLTHAGAGVGRHRDVAVFVPMTCPGDRAQVQVEEVRRDFVLARLMELKQASPDRVRPTCSVFGTCGGCQLQHIAYPKQLELKTELVREALQRNGGFPEPTVLPMLGMAEPWGYRNKALFPVATRGGRIVTGFYASGTHRIVPVDSCPVQHPTNNRIVSEARRAATKYDLSAYDERSGEGTLRHVLGKVAAETGQSMAAFVTGTRVFPQEREIAREMTNRIPGLAGVVHNVNPERTNVVLGPITRTVLGEPAIEDRLEGLRFRVSAESFAQTNPAQARVLYARVLEYAALTAADTAIDAYCGVGTITLLLARKAGKVYGIENVEAAVNDARENARLNRITNVEFVLGDAEKALPDLVRRQVKANVLVLDPPRKGVDNHVIQAALAMGPERIVYVSCDAATMARDLGKLTAGGYALVEVQPVDMFPHTSHVECCALIVRQTKP